MNPMHTIRFETDCPGDTIHLHDEMELLYTLQGRCAVFADDKNFVLGKEDFAVFNPFSSHQLYREEGAHTLSLYIPIQLLNQAEIGTIYCISPLQPEKQASLALLRVRLAELFRDYTENADSRRLNLFAELLELLSILQQDFSPVFSQETSTSRTLKNPERRQNILRYLWEHYQEPITLKSTAAHFYLSDGHFSRLFQELTGRSFSDYLRSVRLSHARRLLLSSETSVTETALSCGFGNVNTFIDAFRREYGLTPGQFQRRSQTEASSLSSDRTGSMSFSVSSLSSVLDDATPGASDVSMSGNSSDLSGSCTNSRAVSYMNLLRHRTSEAKTNLLRLSGSDTIQADFTAESSPLHPVWNRMIGAGYARDLLLAIVQDSIRRSVKEIAFHGFLLHGIFQDEIGVCRRNADGTLRLNFVYLDLVLNLLVEELHTIPWLFLDYAPSCLAPSSSLRQFGDHIMNLPVSLSEWTWLITETLRHMVSVYGYPQVSSWKFSMEQAMQVSVGNCTMEEYKPFYLATFQAIRSVLPDAEIFGFGLDTGYAALEGNTELEELLLFARENHCLPDFLSFQCFFCDYSNFVDIAVDINETMDEVYPLSENENILSDELFQIRQLLKQHQILLPIGIIVSNPGMWGRTPGNDTCFLAAAIVKNAVQNRNQLVVFAPSGLTDYPQTLLPTNTMYHGGSGLITFNGIPKAAYSALMMLSSLSGDVISEGDGYLLTRAKNGDAFDLLLYHYCPYNLTCHRTTVLNPSEERNYDRYYEFEDNGAKSVHVFLKGLPVRPCHLETHYVNRDHGSSYDVWIKMGAPVHPDQALLHYLEYRSVFEATTDTTMPSPDGELTLSYLLEPHEVRVVHGVFE